MKQDETQPETEQRGKSSKGLLLIVFIAIIIVIAWFSVQLVSIAPNAFSSLASLAASMKGPLGTGGTSEPATLTVTSAEPLVNAGDTVRLDWATSDTPGSYVFSYQCAEGIAIDIVGVEGFQSISCETNYNLGDIGTTEIVVSSEKDRYADIYYTIDFLGTNDTTPKASGSATLTVINSSIGSFVTQVATEETPNDSETVIEETEEETEVTETVDPAPEVIERPAEPIYEQEFIYTIPESNPNGRTDLGVKYLGTGTIVGKSFVPGIVERNEAGAIQFEIRNYGTKTSKEWRYTATLPTGLYTSPVQEPLRPNERAVVSLGFPETNVREYTFVIVVDETTDYSPLNDRAVQTVTFQ